MFHKILVPIQDAVLDRPTFDHALVLAQQAQGQMMLLHVLSPDDRTAPAMPNPVLYRYPMITDELMQGYRQHWEMAENEGLAMLKSLTETAQAAGVTPEFSQNLGDVRRVICKLARDWQADLIVIRQPNHSRLDELFLGSVSNYVVHHASCPVLTLPEHP
jgi:nucleotide-binding universal stress UspA family protein